MIAIFYMMIYLLNDGNIPGIPWSEAAVLDDTLERNQVVAQHKSKKSLSYWCKGELKNLK